MFKVETTIGDKIGSMATRHPSTNDETQHDTEDSEFDHSQSALNFSLRLSEGEEDIIIDR